MPVFAYKGVSNAGKNTRGFVDAENLRAARGKLRRDGVFVTEMSESDDPGAGSQASTGSRRISFSFLRRVSGMDLAMVTRQFATLLGAGIPLIESLSALADQTENARLKGLIGRARDRVNEGETLADAFAQTGVFGDLYVSMVRAGETSGALEQVLARLADYMESQERLRNRVITIIVYPAMMMVFALCVVAALVTFVLPQITQLLESLNQPLPVYTRAIIGLSEFVRQFWWAIIASVALVAVGFRSFVRSQSGRSHWDAFKLRLPLIGRVTRLLAISRFSRTLSTLLAGGIAITKALEISRFVANNAVIGDAVAGATESLREGASLAAPLRASGHFPPLVTHMIHVGEQSGELEPMLAKVADTYDEQVENTVTRLTALLEPILIMLMVVVVLGIVFSVLVPLLQITGSIQ